MIQASELRVGNLLYSYNPKTMNHFHILKVKARNIFHLEEHPKSETYQPIPLTPEILEKCGFVSNPYQDRYELSDIHFEYCAIRNIVWCEKYPHIEYLHQLQNLYFALTGKELTVNL